MKFNELKQAMDYQRNNFKGGGYVRKKFYHNLNLKKKQRKLNKARKEKNFEKVKPALENPKEVKEMIDKPKGKSMNHFQKILNSKNKNGFTDKRI